MGVLDFVVNMDILAIICFLLGLVLVIFEMFTPGFGVAGASGAVLLLLGILQTAKSLFQAVLILLIILIILGIAFSIVLNSALKGRLSKSLVLTDSLQKELGYIGTEDMDFFLDKEGTAVTVLRPSGTADFNGIKLDVVSQSEFIPNGSKVKVIKVEGRRVVVSKVDKSNKTGQ